VLYINGLTLYFNENGDKMIKKTIFALAGIFLMSAFAGISGKMFLGFSRNESLIFGAACIAMYFGFFSYYKILE
jgi:hypothetical protein